MHVHLSLAGKLSSCDKPFSFSMMLRVNLAGFALVWVGTERAASQPTDAVSSFISLIKGNGDVKTSLESPNAPDGTRSNIRCVTHLSSLLSALLCEEDQSYWPHLSHGPDWRR